MISLITKGGPLIWPILLCSVFALALVIERLWVFTKMRVDAPAFLDEITELMRRNKVKEAIERCDSKNVPVARILKAGIVKYDQPKEVIREAMEDASLYEVPRLEKNLTALATIAHISPLLGLLGTVTGMVRCFNAIQEKASGFGAVSPGDLAGGISEALLTTVAGLSVAIPTFVVYNYFAARVKFFVVEMERTATELLNFLTETPRHVRRTPE